MAGKCKKTETGVGLGETGKVLGRGKVRTQAPHLKRCRSCWARRAVMTWQSSWMARNEGRCWYCCSTARARPW